MFLLLFQVMKKSNNPFSLSSKERFDVRIGWYSARLCIWEAATLGEILPNCCLCPVAKQLSAPFCAVLLNKDSPKDVCIQLLLGQVV